MFKWQRSFQDLVFIFQPIKTIIQGQPYWSFDWNEMMKQFLAPSISAKVWLIRIGGYHIAGNQTPLCLHIGRWIKAKQRKIFDDYLYMYIIHEKF
jgi:hypothetical protein